jgi:serine protease Do
VGLFEDDFYSTKVGKSRHSEPLSFGGGAAWGQGRERGIKGFLKRERLLVLMTASSLAGAVLTASIFMAASDPKPEAVPVEVTVTGYEKSQDPVVRAAENVLPAVVSIINSRTEAHKGTSEMVGLGSGVIFQKNGSKARIVTNHHVVNNADQLEVVLSNGERKRAAIVGKDAITDLAVLEVDAAGIQQVAEFGDSDLLKPGEPAIAIGNPLGLGFSQSITMGIISSAQRKIPVSFNNDGMLDWEFDAIQTDAAINQGNSGGALVDLNGKVIGINSMKISDTGVEGLGFAIPINQVKVTIESLVEHGTVKRPFIGVTTIGFDPRMKGISVLKVPETVQAGLIVLDAVGPASNAGLATNDVIIELDGHPVGSTLDLRKYLYTEKKIGEKLKVTFYRGDKKMTVTLTLAESKKE